MTTQNSETPSASSELTPDSSTVAHNLSPKDEKKLIAWANEQFVKMKNSRIKTEKQWYLNMAFYFGQQNVVFRGTGGNQNSFQLYTPPAPYYRSRPIINMIRPRIRTEMSKLTAQKPNAFVVPASSDDRDMYAANAGEQIWDALYRFKKVHSVVRRAVFWACITGNGFIKSYWDENKIDEQTGEPGDICYDPETPFHIFVPDLAEEDIERQPFVCHASMRNADMLKNKFGQEIKFEPAKGQIVEESFLNLMGVQKWEKNREVLCMEFWVKPGTTAIMPAGGMFTVAGNKILYYSEEWPYEHQKYPFAHIGHVQTGKFYRDSVITDMIPLQREYNRTRGQIIEAKNRMAKPQLAAEIGSIDASKVTSEPGQIIMYRPGFQAPMPIPLQSLPSYVLEEQERIKMDLDEISGQHEVSRGQVPAGVTAATAISYLQEQDESKLSYTFDSLEEALEKIAYMSLNYVHQYWNTPRKIKITGADGSFDVMAFEGSMLRGNTDIRIEAGSALPTSKAAKQAFIMDLMKMGFIDPNKGLEVMEIGGINKIYEQVQVDVRQAQRENLKMAQATADLIEAHKVEELNKYFQTPQGQQAMQMGMLFEGPNGDLMDASPTQQGQPPQQVPIPLIVPVNTWDDHRIHIERHNNYRKSQAFENLPQEAKDLFEQHVQQHVSAIMVGAMGALPPELVDAGMFDMNAASHPESYKESLQALDQQQGSKPESNNGAQQTPGGSK